MDIDKDVSNHNKSRVCISFISISLLSLFLNYIGIFIVFVKKILNNQFTSLLLSLLSHSIL